jgi:hypothetical protein
MSLFATILAPEQAKGLKGIGICCKGKNNREQRTESYPRIACLALKNT